MRSIFEDFSAHDKARITIVFQDIELVVDFPLNRLFGNTANRQQIQYGFQKINHPMQVLDEHSSCEDVSDMETDSENNATSESEHIPKVWGGLNYVPHKPPPYRPCVHKCRDEEDKDIPHTASTDDTSPAILEVEDFPNDCLGLKDVLVETPRGPRSQECEEDEDLDLTDSDSWSFSTVTSLSDFDLWDSGDEDDFSWHSGSAPNRLVNKTLI